MTAWHRKTVENVCRAGLALERLEELAPGGLDELIVARPAASSRPGKSALRSNES
jgi:hypothetical protein